MEQTLWQCRVTPVSAGQSISRCRQLGYTERLMRENLSNSMGIASRLGRLRGSYELMYRNSEGDRGLHIHGRTGSNIFTPPRAPEDRVVHRNQVARQQNSRASSSGNVEGGKGEEAGIGDSGCDGVGEQMISPLLPEPLLRKEGL